MLDSLPDVFLELGGRGTVRKHIGGGATDPVLCPASLVGRKLHECWPPQTADECIRQIRKVLATRGPHQFQLTFDEPAKAYEVRLYPRGRDRVLAVLRNVQRTPGRDSRFVDTLTGLSTRERFLAGLEQVLHQERLRERHLALIYLDLERFSQINETLGRRAGDAVLRTVATRIEGCMRGCDQVIQFSSANQSSRLARVGGDKFVMLFSAISSQDDVRNLARRLRRLFLEPIQCDHTTVAVEPRIGIALFPQDGRDAESLFASARMALNQAQDYAAKTGIFFSGELLACNQQVDSAQELRWAIDQGQLELHYLPRIRLADKVVTGLEGLLHWRHPIRGLLMTDEILPLADTCGLTEPISDWVRQHVCDFARQLSQSSGPAPVLSINLGEREFAQPHLPQQIAASLEAATLAGNRLQLEITEPTLMRHRQGPATLRQLKALGVRIVIDNFGTGHISLSELAAVPLDGVKIGRRITQAIDSDPVSRRLCAAIIALGRELKLEVIAEGIEMAQQHSFLRDHGCQGGQGGFFGPPLPAASVASFLAKHSDLAIGSANT